MGETGKNHRRAQTERGFTLIELFLGLALAAILGTIIWAVVTSQGRAYNIQDRMTQMQQALRVSMEFVARDTAMAGYGTASYTVTDTALGVGGLLPAIRGYEGGVGKSDVLQVVYADPSRMAMTSWGQNQTCSATQLVFQNFGDVNIFRDSEYMLCFDYSSNISMKSFLFRLTGYDSNTGLVQEGSGSLDPETGMVAVTVPLNPIAYSGENGQCPSGENLPRDLQCGPANIHTYYIDDDESDGVGPGTANHPVLMMSINIKALDNTNGVVQTVAVNGWDIALADNIEALQVKVCSVANSLDCDEEVDFVDWNLASVNLNSPTYVEQVRQVSITLWARSDRRTPEGSSAGGLNPITGVIDGYFHRAQKTTVLVRNLRLLADSY